MPFVLEGYQISLVNLEGASPSVGIIMILLLI